MSMLCLLPAALDSKYQLHYTTAMDQELQSTVVPESDDAALLAFVERWELEQEIYAEFG